MARPVRGVRLGAAVLLAVTALAVAPPVAEAAGGRKHPHRPAARYDARFDVEGERVDFSRGMDCDRLPILLVTSDSGRRVATAEVRAALSYPYMPYDQVEVVLDEVKVMVLRHERNVLPGTEETYGESFAVSRPGPRRHRVMCSYGVQRFSSSPTGTVELVVLGRVEYPTRDELHERCRTAIVDYLLEFGWVSGDREEALRRAEEYLALGACPYEHARG